MIEGRLYTPFEAYFNRQQHFYSNGRILFVRFETLDGYVDAAGTDSPNEQVMTVNGCLSTQAKWKEFSCELQKYLKDQKFQPDFSTGSEMYVFHATDFCALDSDKCEWNPKGLTLPDKIRIYHDVVSIIKKHTLFRFGFGIWLDDLKLEHLEQLL